MADAVSVVIPTRDRSHIVVDTVRSTLCQRHVELEVIVVDDGSRDATAEALEALGDPRVTVLRNASSCGVAGARNRGIERAAHPWIAFLDDDDRWSPDKLRVQLDRAHDGGCRLRLHGRTGGRSRRRAGALDVPGIHARGAATRHSQPQRRFRGLVQRGRAHRAPAASRRLRRVASPHRGLGSVDPPDRGGATGRVPRTVGGVRRARGEHAPDRDRQRGAGGPPATRQARAQQPAGPVRSRRLPRVDRRGTRPLRASRARGVHLRRHGRCATAAGPMHGARWAQRCAPSASAARTAPPTQTAPHRTGWRSDHSSHAIASSNELGSSSSNSARPSNSRSDRSVIDRPGPQKPSV